jgi:hypothetical protein
MLEDNNKDSRVDHLQEVHPHASKSKDTDWRSAVDSTSGKTYYWNKRTKETTWHIPPELSDTRMSMKYSDGREASFSPRRKSESRYLSSSQSSRERDRLRQKHDESYSDGYHYDKKSRDSDSHTKPREGTEKNRDLERSSNRGYDTHKERREQRRERDYSRDHHGTVKSKNPCYFWDQGYCQKGDCPFTHDGQCNLIYGVW